MHDPISHTFMQSHAEDSTLFLRPFNKFVEPGRWQFVKYVAKRQVLGSLTSDSNMLEINPVRRRRSCRRPALWEAD